MDLLIVDDIDINRKMLKYMLESVATTVDFDGDGISAFKKTINKRYDVILMDINMPHMDGVNSVKLIRESEMSMCKEALIIAVTAYPDEYKLAKKNGFDHVVEKPIDHDRIVELVKQKKRDL